VLDEIAAFLGGLRDVPAEPSTILTTVFEAELAESERALLQPALVRFRGRELDAPAGRIRASFDGPARAIRCACAVRDTAAELGIEIRAGIHTGECELIDNDLAGVAVHVAARVGAAASGSEILVSEETLEGITVGHAVSEPREYDLKGLGKRQLAVIHWR
jgi:class 3 adenylate cyclase